MNAPLLRSDRVAQLAKKLDTWAKVHDSHNVASELLQIIDREIIEALDREVHIGARIRYEPYHNHPRADNADWRLLVINVLDAALPTWRNELQPDETILRRARNTLTTLLATPPAKPTAVAHPDAAYATFGRAVHDALCTYVPDWVQPTATPAADDAALTIRSLADRPDARRIGTWVVDDETKLALDGALPFTEGHYAVYLDRQPEPKP